MKKLKTLLVLAVVSLVGFNANAQQVQLTSVCGGSYQQNFNSTLNNTFVDPSTLLGWYHSGLGEVNTNVVRPDNGSLQTPTGLRNYFNPANTDYSLGNLNTAGNNGRMGIILQNLTGSPISSFTITYTGEQWRKSNNGGQQDRLEFSYSDMITGTPHTANPGGLTAGTFTNIAGLNFIAPQNEPSLCNAQGLSLDGNAAANRRTMTAVITLSTPLANGNFIIFRWSDINTASCGDHGMSIDDVKIDYTTVSSPPAPITGSTTVCDNGRYIYFLGNGTVGTLEAKDAFGATLGTVGTVMGTPPNRYFEVDLMGAPVGAANMIITNTVAAEGCTPGGVTKLNVKVLAAPVAGTITEVSHNCNTLTFELTGYEDQIARWEYSTDNSLWVALNNTNSVLTYTLPNDGLVYEFRAVVTRSGGACQEVISGPTTGSYTGVSLPVLVFTSNGTCSTTDLTISNSLGATGTYSITPGSRPSQFTDIATFTSLSAGTYTITFMDPIGSCSVSKSITITSSPATAPTMLPAYSISRTAITPEWNAYGGAASYTLQWRKSGVTAWNTITGITARRRAVSGLTCNTTYQFRVRAMCSNGTASPYSTIVSFTTQPCVRESITSNLTTSDLSLYPNPNNGNFNLNFVAEGAGNATLFVADITGKTVTNQTITLTEGENNIPVSLDGVAPGIYLVRFTVGENTFTQKVIVE